MEKKNQTNKIAIYCKNSVTPCSFLCVLLSSSPEITWSSKNRNFDINCSYTLLFTPFICHMLISNIRYLPPELMVSQCGICICSCQVGLYKEEKDLDISKRSVTVNQETQFEGMFLSLRKWYTLWFHYLFIVKRVSYSWVAEGLISSL